jgi:HemY protein
MIRAIFFMIKVGLLVAAAVWVAQREGSVSIDWMEYTFHMHVGVFLGIVVVTILLAITIFRVFKGIADFPKSLKRYNYYGRRDKGYRALTLGLAAVAAGDAKSAAYQAHRAEKMLAGDTGLPLLLKAQAARLEGREDDAREVFLKLLENKDAAFLGVRGLLQAAVDHRDYTQALELARRALELHPKQPWILRVVYDLEVRARDWEAAGKTLYRAQKAGALDAAKANSDRVAILMAQAEENIEREQKDDAFVKLKKAYQYDPYFAPVVVRLAGQYAQRDNRRRAVAVVEKAWKKSPHPDLVPVWDLLIPRKKVINAALRLKWYERLLSLRPGSIEARLAAARAAMEEGLWGEARHHLTMAEQEHAVEETPDARLYKLWSELEDRSTQNDDVSQHWLEKAAESPLPRCWVCRQTGRVYTQWAPVAQPHGSFNTIIWERPDHFEWSSYNLPSGSDAYIEAPRN